MHKFLFLTLFLISGTLSIASENSKTSPTPEDLVDFDNLDIPYLEYLLKVKIDSIRQSYGSTALANHQILYKAAIDHANYLLNRNIISHHQVMPQKRTAMRRAEYYGAKNLRIVGENVLWNNIARIREYDPSTRTIEERFFHTYDKLANDLVQGWLDSESHYETLKKPVFQFTGLAVSYDATKKQIMAVQVFAEFNHRQSASK